MKLTPKCQALQFAQRKFFQTIKSFEDAMVAIDYAKFEYSITLEKHKSFSKR